MIVKGKARKDGRDLALYFMKSEEGARRIFGTDPAGDTLTAMTEWDELGALTRGEKPLYHLQLCPDAKYPVTDAQWKHMADIVLEELGAKGHDYELYFHPGVKDNGEPDKPHAHLGVCRTNRDTLKMIDLSYNYAAHERASKRIALEYGWELVPGKHAKRDREKQPEFPRQAFDQAEAQQAARQGLDPTERREQITALRQSCDNGQTFRDALEQAGYILAKGDKRGFVLVDGEGEIYSLSRHVTDIKGKDYKAFMQPVDPAALPDVEQAKALQAQRAAAVAEKAREDARKQAPPLPSKFMRAEAAPPAAANEKPETPKKAAAARQAKASPQPEKKARSIDPDVKAEVTALRAWADGAAAFKNALAEKGYILARGQNGYCLVTEDDVYSLVRYAGTTKAKLDAFMAPIPLDALPTVQDVVAAQRDARAASKFLPRGWTPPEPPVAKTGDDDLAARVALSALDRAVDAIVAAQKQASPDPELEALENAIARRRAEEAAKLHERHEIELRDKEIEMDREIARQIAGRKAQEEEQIAAFLAGRKEARAGVRGLIDAIQNRWNPELAAEKARERERERRNFYRRLAKERADYEVLLQQNKQMEIEALIERQRLQSSDFQARAEEDKERYVRDYHEARRLRAELAEQERKQQEALERDDSLGDGPPPPKLGKP